MVKELVVRQFKSDFIMKEDHILSSISLIKITDGTISTDDLAVFYLLLVVCIDDSLNMDEAIDLLLEASNTFVTKNNWSYLWKDNDKEVYLMAVPVY